MRSFRRFLRLPVDDDGRCRLLGFWPPSAANVLVSLSFGVFVAQNILGAGRHNPLEAWGSLSAATLRAGEVWRLVTHLFLHDNPLTLFVNAIFIYFAGRNLEAIIGRRHFLAIFLLGGSLAGAVRAFGVLNLPFETARAALLGSVDPVMGAGGAAMAVLLAFTLIMPEIELGALVYLPAPAGRLRAKDLAIGALLGPALLFAVFASPLAIPPDPVYAWRLSCAGTLVGAIVGWLYARGLGFGRRWPCAAAGSAASRAGDVPASPRRDESLEGVAPSSSSPSPDAAAVAPASAPPSAAVSWSSPAATAATAAAPQPAAVSPLVGSSNANPNAAPAPAPAPAAPPAGPSLSEREQRMTAREYIAEAVDPVLEKIHREGLGSLSDVERRILQTAREKLPVTSRVKP